MQENSSNENTKLISDIEDFLDNCGHECLKAFRYYEPKGQKGYQGNRKELVARRVESHIETILITLSGGDAPVAYGHLDACHEGKVWLGLCVADDAQGLGLGRVMIKYLLSKYDGEVNMTVDVDNTPSINLCKQYGFENTRTNVKMNDERGSIVNYMRKK
tara:strand:+ start:17509 stop:17988 length:480 start_codon:yes stop_codon:yes gene_type:complete